MKTITAKSKGIEIVYHDTQRSTFIPYMNNNAYSQRPKSKYNNYQMNTVQYGMYQRLMYGLEIFDKEQLATLDQNTKFAISNMHNRAMDVLNELKYDRTYGYINKLFKVIFPTVELNYYKDGKEHKYTKLPTLKELKLTTLDIINVWIKNKLLPLDFYNLNEKTVTL
jgi:hypothetical protein